MLYTQSLKASQALEYLTKEKMAVLSTLSGYGTVDSAAIFFMADEKFNFYFTTKIGTRKYQSLSGNPVVSLTIANADQLKTVEVKGIASVITDSAEIARRITDLINLHRQEGVPWAPPIAKLSAGHFAVVKVTPTWLRFGIFKNEEPAGEYFTQIIPDEPAKHAGLS